MNSANLLELLNALLNSSWYFARSNGQLEPYCKYFRSSTDSSFNERFKANLFFRVEPKLSEDMLLPRWSSILLCFPLCMIYFRHSSKLQNSFIILKQFWSYCQNRDLKKTGTPNFLLTGGIALYKEQPREEKPVFSMILYSLRLGTRGQNVKLSGSTLFSLHRWLEYKWHWYCT